MQSKRKRKKGKIEVRDITGKADSIFYFVKSWVYAKNWVFSRSTVRYIKMEKTVFKSTRISLDTVSSKDQDGLGIYAIDSEVYLYDFVANNFVT